MEMTLLELLQKYGGNDEALMRVEELGVESIEDLLQLEVEMLTGVGLKYVHAKRLLAEVREMYVEEKEEEEAKQELATSEVMKQILDIPLDDDSLLEQIKQKNELRVDDSAYVAAIRADLADRTGLLDVPAKLTVEMENFAEKNDMPVSKRFFDIQALITRRNYADIFAAMPNHGRNLINKSRKQTLLKKMQQHFWPAVFSAFLEIRRWRQLWLSSVAPEVSMYYAQRNTEVPPGVGMAPDVGPLKDAAEKLRVAMNKTLSGLSSMAADALLADCIQVKEILLTEKLPEAIGAVDYDQMLAMLNINIDSNIVRTEHNLVHFVLGMANSKDVSEKEEVRHFSALYVIGSQISWQLIGFRTQELESLRSQVENFSVIMPEPTVLEAENGAPTPQLGTSHSSLDGIPRLLG